MPQEDPRHARTLPPPAAPGRPRIIALDVVRGFALCGILLANVQPISHIGTTAVTEAQATIDDAARWLGLLVEQRFFPIFSLLFGVGFSLLLDSAGRRVPRPRVLLVRRLLVLLVMGLAHMFLLWRGDILTIYALVGLVVLLPSTWLPRWAVAGLAVVLVAAAMIVFGGGTMIVPGLFLLGSALTRYGVIARIESSTLVPALLALLFGAGTAATLVLQGSAEGLPMAASGLAMAGLYVCTLLVLLRTPLRPVLRTLFAPLGRMALTNYLSATALVLIVGKVVGGRPEGWSLATIVSIAAVILVLQWVWSTLWLRRYRFGPMEWLWRWATWGSRPAQRVP
ncbi:DUF418 domain-containing protein [Nonomuraea spiralis]|uniref:DUF418 domain-containing protein n=1 Tax=Nonomuraea spiralis TaxID=46182 RepID=A0ABV5IAF1_9ACTN|nr:DUF418 domain-containing protein [Nonomuraea spiralis]GGT04381.1 hypothetical protein GCM10010176_055800 [Nonomuraea spiralis]